MKGKVINCFRGPVISKQLHFEIEQPQHINKYVIQNHKFWLHIFYYMCYLHVVAVFFFRLFFLFILNLLIFPNTISRMKTLSLLQVPDRGTISNYGPLFQPEVRNTARSRSHRRGKWLRKLY